jgi:thiosulfate reductase cytochrome b subunit
MIGLGVTGAFQNRIAKAWGYGTWRFTHFLLGMLVVAFIVLHVFVDGVDFQFLRDYFLAPAA